MIKRPAPAKPQYDKALIHNHGYSDRGGAPMTLLQCLGVKASPLSWLQLSSPLARPWLPAELDPAAQLLSQDIRQEKKGRRAWEGSN